MTVRRALTVVVRVLIGYSDVWLAVMLPGVLLFSMWELRSLQAPPALVVGSLAAWAFMAVTLPVAMSAWRRVTVTIPWALAWALGAVVAVGVLARAVTFTGRTAVAVVGTGVLLAASGLVVDLAVTVVGAFGPGRSSFAFRPGLVLIKFVTLALAAGALVLTAGTVGARAGGAGAAIAFAMVLSVPAVLALLVSPMYWGLRPPDDVDRPEVDERDVPLADRRRGARARRGRSDAGLREGRSGGTIASTRDHDQTGSQGAGRGGDG